MDGLHLVPARAPLPGVACALVFRTHSEGTLLMKWSSEAVPEACVLFAPKDVSKVPKFKLSSKAETEICRGFGGGGRAKFYEGICSFIKSAKELRSPFLVLLTDTFKLFLRMPDGTVVELRPGVPFTDLDSAQCVAALNGSSDALVDGIALVQPLFVRTAVDALGAAMDLSDKHISRLRLRTSERVRCVVFKCPREQPGLLRSRPAHVPQPPPGMLPRGAPPRFSRDDLVRAFAHYRRVKDQCSASGDWKPFAELFAEDAYYVEHAYGEFKGRKEIERYIVNVMAPFPTMRFVEDWITFDEDHGAVIWQLQNVFPPPNKPDGTPFQFPNISRLLLHSIDSTGVPLFREEQDWYNPGGTCSFHAGPTTRAWRKAGGVFVSKEKLLMTHDPKAAVAMKVKGGGAHKL